MFGRRLMLKSASKDASFIYQFSSLFMAGYVNAAALFVCASFVTHLTGFSTQLGVSIAMRQWAELIEAASIPFWFINGVIVSGYCAVRTGGYSPEVRHGKAMGWVGLCLLVAAIGGYSNLFTQLGAVLNFDGVYFCIALLAFASGLQNGAITLSSGGSVRSTHLTGLVTDMGLGIARLYLASGENQLSPQEKKLLKLRFAFFLTFIAGACLGAVLQIRLDYLTFLLPSLIAFGLRIYSHKDLSSSQYIHDPRVVHE
jgi:uncharacterized membrane protein YoaK (UPF0700 family)